VLVIAFPGGAATASLVQQALRRSSHSPVPVVVMEVGQSIAALQMGQQAITPKPYRKPTISAIAKNAIN
jgi:hypothetical protein